MPDTDILVSELNSASQINTTDLLLMTQPDGDAQTGYSSRKGTVLQVANKLLKDTEYTTDLPNFDNKSVFGALNEIHNGTYIYKENETPYQLRQTPITANRCLEKLVGVSCAFNQLCGYQDETISQNGISMSYSAATGKITVVVNNPTGFCQLSFTNGNVTGGHKILITTSENLSTGMEFYARNVSITAGKNSALSSLSDNAVLAFYADNTTPNGTYEYILQCFDLTACFGSEVADYFYNLENG